MSVAHCIRTQQYRIAFTIVTIVVCCVQVTVRVQQFPVQLNIVQGGFVELAFRFIGRFAYLNRAGGEFFQLQQCRHRWYLQLCSWNRFHCTPSKWSIVWCIWFHESAFRFLHFIYCCACVEIEQRFSLMCMARLRYCWQCIRNSPNVRQWRIVIAHQIEYTLSRCGQ